MSWEHPNKLELERFTVEDLPPPERDRVAAHIHECPQCQSYLDALQSFSRDRLSAAPPEPFMAQLAERRVASRRWLSWQTGLGSFAAATATAAVLWFVLPSLLFDQKVGAIDPPSPHIRFKGGGVAIHRKRGTQVGVLPDNGSIRAGDALQVVITLDRPAPVALWFVDVSGQVDRLHPSEKLMLSAGEHSMDGSAIIEHPCKDMWLVVAIGAAAAGGEQALKTAVSSGAAADLSWVPPGAVARFLRCK